MKKRLLLTLLFALTGSALLAQDSWDTIGEAVPGYYIKNGIRYNTLIELESDELRAKRLYLPRQYGLNQEIYTPEEISEYGTLRERRFVSVDLGGEWFFMEVLQQVDHDTSIVFLSHKVLADDTYYLIDEGVIKDLGTGRSPGPMWDYLSSLNDCTHEWDMDVKYPNHLASRMVRRYYNAFVHCNEKMFPRVRFGVRAGIGLGRPSIDDARPGSTLLDDETYDPRPISYTDLKYRYNMSFSFGVFARIPIDEVVSFQPELLYHRLVAGGAIDSEAYTAVIKDVGYINNSIRLPMMFRFTNNYARKNMMPYAELGPVFDFNSGQYWFTGSNMPRRNLSVFAAGVSVGVGAEYYINTRQAASLGVRVSYVDNFIRLRNYSQLTFELVAGFSIFDF